MTLSPITLKKFFFLLRDSFPFNDKVSQDCHTPEPTIKLQTEAQELGFLMDVAVTSFPSAQRGYLYLPPPQFYAACGVSGTHFPARVPAQPSIFRPSSHSPGLATVQLLTGQPSW